MSFSKQLCNAFLGFTITDISNGREGFITSYSEDIKRFHIIWDDPFEFNGEALNYIKVVNEITSLLTFEEINDIHRFNLTSAQRKVERKC